MEKELLAFVKDNGLNPWKKSKTLVRGSVNSIYKTKDAKEVHSRVLESISKEFYFTDTGNILKFFGFSNDINEIKKRQAFFGKVERGKVTSFLKGLKVPKPVWKPPYSVLAVTEDGDVYNELQKLGVPVKLLISETDVRELEGMDIVQVIECEEYGRILEQLPQSVFLNSVDDVYLERYVSLLSGWLDNLELLKGKNLGKVDEIIAELDDILPLARTKKAEMLTRERLDEIVEEMNLKVNEKIKGMNFSGDLFVQVLQGKELPDELKEIINEEIRKSGIDKSIFVSGLPVRLDEQEAERFLRGQDLDAFTLVAEGIKKNARALRGVPGRLEELERELLMLDFTSGVGRWLVGRESFPQEAEEFYVKDALNVMLKEPQPISFHLNDSERCSVLTGANSGGKTTLLEHVIQYISCFQLGLPVAGELKTPLFSEVYYFAKTKGSMSKGAFETILTQMSGITPGKKTLILADEIEAVTEPGVAGKMIAATAAYFLEKGCFLVIATHLGQEIAKSKPVGARIDGIEAKGLDEFNELIVDHNPVLGRLASSTPELIVEKMARGNSNEYFGFLNSYLRDKE
jgi:DNA mismatch repair protein MutS2